MMNLPKMFMYEITLKTKIVEKLLFIYGHFWKKKLKILRL